MKIRIIIILAVIQIVTTTILIIKISNLNEKLDKSALTISELEKLIEEKKSNNINDLPKDFKESNLNDATDKTASLQNKVENEIENKTDIDILKERQKNTENYNFVSTSDDFYVEKTNIDWAIKHEENFNRLFSQSNDLSGVGLVSVECHATLCKVLVTRSHRGSFTDAAVFGSELEKQKWGKRAKYSFQFGAKGEEEYLTLWIKL